MTIAVALWTPRRWYEVSTTASRTVTGGLQDLGKLRRIAGVVLISLVGQIHLRSRRASLPPCGGDLRGTGRVRAWPAEEEGYRFVR